MQRTKIEWTDYTWNPVTGCWGPGGTLEKPKRCAYCYARRMAGRFMAGEPEYDLFAPRFHAGRLHEPTKVKKPSQIFVGSIADLFGDWVPKNWIQSVLKAASFAPWHTYQFLTKNPQRLQEFNPWPKNCWIGATITNQTDAEVRLPWLLRADARVRFVSHEPLLGAIDMRHAWCMAMVSQINLAGYSERPTNGSIEWLHWAIIGAMTGPGAVEADPEWVYGLTAQYQQSGVPVFLKDNLKWPVKIQEFPNADL